MMRDWRERWDLVGKEWERREERGKRSTKEYAWAGQIFFLGKN
jgi:hypothetical protein